MNPRMQVNIPRTHWATLRRGWLRSDEPCPKGLAYIDRVWTDNDGEFTEMKLVVKSKLNNYINEEK